MIKTNRLKLLRDQYVKPDGTMGLSLKELSILTGIPKSTLGEMEIHKAKISPKRVGILCEVFNCEEDKLFIQPK
jgi:transcriptional regulator with XRE-family HTH domain